VQTRFAGLRFLARSSNSTHMTRLIADRHWFWSMRGRCCRRPKLPHVAGYCLLRMPFKKMLRKFWITSSWVALG
jgi:hypothetical protein